jgi:Flp pilus assembly protein TadD
MKTAGRVEEAIELLRKAIAMRPKSVEPRLSLVDAMISAEKYDEALVEADIAIHLDPTHAQPQHMKGVVLSRVGRNAEAEACFREALRLEPEAVFCLSGLGMQLFMVGEYAESAELFRRAVVLDPSSASGQRALARVEAVLGRPAQALAAADAAVALNPVEPLSHDARGKALIDLGRYTEGAESLAETARLSPQDSCARANYGEALILCGRSADAEVELREATRLGPANAIEAAVLLAIAVHGRDREEAVALARHALTCPPEANITPFRHREFRSIALLLTGDVDGAVSELRDAADAWRAKDIVQEPIYDQLRSITSSEAVDTLLAAWPPTT